MTLKTTQADLLLDLKLVLGEGPIWDAQRSCLLFVDILSSRLFRYDPVTETIESFDTERHVGTVVVRETGGFVLARADGFVAFDPGAGLFTRIADPEPGLPENRFNDGKCDPRGRLWAGTMDCDARPGKGRLYRLDAAGSVFEMAAGFTIPNGIVWAGDRKTLYHIDSPEGRVFAWDYDDETGAIKNRRTAILVPDGMGSPDGMAIDTDGHLWVALYGGSAVGCFDPDLGRLLELVEVPCSQVTACAFGGTDLKTLYITTARQNLRREALDQEPSAGGLFVARPGATGVESVPFSG